MLFAIILMAPLMTHPEDARPLPSFYINDACNKEVALEDTPSIFKETRCMGSIKLPGKPKPLGGPDPGEIGWPVIPFPTGPNPSKLPWKSGFSPGTSVGSIALTKAAGFGGWRGRDVDVGIVFIGKNSWMESYEAFLSNIVIQPSGAVAAFLSKGIYPVMTVPMVTKADAGKFSMVASGGIDAKHLAIAKKIASVTQGRPIYLRLGHEADEGYPWSYTGNDGAEDPANPATYRAAWGRIASIYHNNVPGAIMVWNVLKNTRLKVADYYPGDGVVDVISIDIYDNGSGGYCDSPTSPGWNNFCFGGYNAAAGTSKGANGILQFAKSHGKKIAFDEWGATNDNLSASNGANNSWFVTGMFNFFAENYEYIEYESYYNRDGGGRHQIWDKTSYNPLPSEAYLNAYQPK